MTKSTGSRGSGKGGSGGKVANLPSKTGNPSGVAAAMLRPAEVRANDVSAEVGR